MMLEGLFNNNKKKSSRDREKGLGGTSWDCSILKKKVPTKEREQRGGRGTLLASPFPATKNSKSIKNFNILTLKMFFYWPIVGFKVQTEEPLKRQGLKDKRQRYK